MQALPQGAAPSALARLPGGHGPEITSKSGQAFVPSFFVEEVLAQLANTPADLLSILAEARFDSGSFDLACVGKATEGVVCADAFGRFWLAAARSINNELLDQGGPHMPCGSFTLLSHSVLHAQRLDRALQRMLRFYRVVVRDHDVRLSVVNNVAEIALLENGPPRASISYAMFFTSLLGLARWLVDRPIALTSAELRSNPTTGLHHYQVMLCDDLRLGRPRTLVRFDAALLNAPINRCEEQLKRFLRRAPGNLLLPYQSVDSAVGRVSDKLRRIHPRDWPCFDALCRSMNTTASTLRRRLEAEGASYQNIKDDVRRKLAVEHLQKRAMCNADIADELGFEDPSTFYRAFRRWTGVTPTAFRSGKQERERSGLPQFEY